MRDRLEQILRIACAVFVALILAQIIRAGFQADQLAGIKIPVAPTLETKTNLIAGSEAKLKTKNLNVVAIAKKSISTNSKVAQKNAATNLISTNAVAQAAANNNLITGTNSIALDTVKISKKHFLPSMAMAVGMNGFPMTPGMQGSAPKLPPEIQARVDKIVNSEIFGPVMHPLPMGLLGIAGDMAFLRAADGQTGLVKAGDSLGDLKLLRIGINRVLVEQGGQKKELMIFDGYGGESLLSNTNEILK